MDPATASNSVENAARDSYAQLLSYLSASCGGDLASAEDALSEAFLAAMKQWPAEGVPAKPEAWLLTAARRKLIDTQRRAATRTREMDAITHAMQAALVAADSEHEFPDERLKLLFVCAHPAIDPAARTPLMLQTVLGIDAQRIAAAFLTTPFAMSQRLVRAKVKIRDAGITFEIPPRDQWPERLGFVHDAIYAAFTTGWEDVSSGLAEEAIWLARVLSHLMADDPETLGLLSLLLFSHSRQKARVHDGKYVPLPEQDIRLWDQDLREQAESVLHMAARHNAPGRFQLEAAIQSVHAARAFTGEIRWEAIATLYDTLINHTPAVGAHVARAVAYAMNGDPERGLAILQELPQCSLPILQPYWAARAHILALLGRRAEAKAAFEHALEQSASPEAHAYIASRLELL